MVSSSTPDEFRRKGALEQESPEQKGNTSLRGQLGHRTDDPIIKAYDSDYPEPGENPEHSGQEFWLQQPEANPEEDAESADATQEPGHRQKENQGDEEEDPLAA